MNVLKDEFNLRLLRYLVSGNGVKVNISCLAREIGIHRETAKRKLNFLYENNLLNSPQYPFPLLYKKYPLLVLVKADMPRSREAINFYEDDSHIFAAFSCMEGPYNTLLIEFFEDLEMYHSWREEIVQENRIPTRENRAAAHAYIFSNKLTFKYEPNCFIKKMKKMYENYSADEFIMNDIELDKISFKVLENLMEGNCIRTNDSYLARELGSNRKTIKRRIKNLEDKGVIEPPKSYFPNLFVPPGYNLIVSMMEIKSQKEEIKNYLKNDANIPRAVETSTERYNFLVFSAFPTIDDFFNWGEKLNSRFPNCVGAISNTILSSQMIHTIKPQKVSLGWIERRLWELKQK